MLAQDILIFLALVGEALCDQCYHYTYGLKYCSGYCSGFYGSQHCIYYSGYYILSGGAIAGLVIGLLSAAAFFVVIIIVCIKQHNRKTVGGVIGPAPLRTTVAVTSTHNSLPPPGYMQPMATYSSAYTSSGQMGAPPLYSAAYPPPPAYPGPAGYSAPTQPQYNSVFNQPDYYKPVQTTTM